MQISVNESAIAARAATRRQQESTGVDLWVSLNGAERQRAAADTRTAAARATGSADDWRILPTSSGTYVWLYEARSWPARVAALASELQQLGHAGSIDVAPVDPWREVLAEHAFPTVMMAHRLDPPLSAGPMNAFGRPQRRWGLTAEATQRLLARRPS